MPQPHLIRVNNGKGHFGGLEWTWQVYERAREPRWQSIDVAFTPTWSGMLNATARLRKSRYTFSTDVGDLTASPLGSDRALQIVQQCLDGTAAANPLTIKFIIPSTYGQISRSDIVEIRMSDCQWVELCVSLSRPLQIYNGTTLEVGEDLHLSKIFEHAAASLLLQDKNGPATEGDAEAALHNDLINRLSFPWIIDNPVPRRTLAIVEGCHIHPAHGGYAPMIYEGAKALGLDVVVLDSAGHWIEGPEYADWRVEFIPFDLPDCPDEQLGCRIADTIRSCGRKIGGMVTPSEYYKCQIADACQQLGLPTAPPEAYTIATDKYKMRIFAGINSYLVTSADEAVPLATDKSLDPPLIVKLCRGWSFDGVTRVEAPEDIPKAFEAIGTNIHGTDVSLEPCCDGPEFDYNVVLWDGEILFDQLCDNLPKSAEVIDSANGTFKEIDCPFPSLLPASEIEMVREQFCAILRRMGLQSGVFHLEGRVDCSTIEYKLLDGIQHMETHVYANSDRHTPKPWLHEVNPRPPGMTASKIV